MLPKIFILNGPNLNLLGTREPEIYGHQTLADIEALCRSTAKLLRLEIDFRQTNHEGELIDWVQEAKNAKGLIINAAGLTHTSVSLGDALMAIKTPIIEVHLSNPLAREHYRHNSYVSPAAKAVICGLKSDGYRIALEAMKGMIG